jgi:hypothetical protein
LQGFHKISFAARPSHNAPQRSEGKEHREASSSLSTSEHLKKRKWLFFVGIKCALPFLQLSQPSERTFNFRKQMLLLRAERAFGLLMGPLSGPKVRF